MKYCGSFAFFFSEEEVNSLYLGDFFLLQEHTYAQCGSQSHPVCFLTTSCSRLWQKANRWVDLNFLVMQHDTEASCLPEHALEKHFN